MRLDIDVWSSRRPAAAILVLFVVRVVVVAALGLPASHAHVASDAYAAALLGNELA
jgi:hypothetical protein